MGGGWWEGGGRRLLVFMGEGCCEGGVSLERVGVEMR